MENKKNDEGLTLSMEVDGGERSGDGSSDIMGRRGRRARVAGSLGGGLYDVKKKQKLIEACSCAGGAFTSCLWRMELFGSLKNF